MLRKQAVFDRETFLTLPDLPPRLKLWGEDRELEDFLVKKAFMINPIPSSVARADGEVFCRRSYFQFYYVRCFQ